jgi:hypothetical protein
VQFDLYVASALDSQLAVGKQLPAVAKLRIGQAVVAAGRLKSWEAWLVASFHTGEESRERLIQSPQHILTAAEVRERQATVCLHHLQLVSLIVVVDRLVASLVRAYSLLKPRVIKRAGFPKFSVQKLRLHLGWVQAIFIGKTHSTLGAGRRLIQNWLGSERVNFYVQRTKDSHI